MARCPSCLQTERHELWAKLGCVGEGRACASPPLTFSAAATAAGTKILLARRDAGSGFGTPPKERATCGALSLSTRSSYTDLRLFAIHRNEAPHRCKIRVLPFDLWILLLPCRLGTFSGALPAFLGQQLTHLTPSLRNTQVPQVETNKSIVCSQPNIVHCIVVH